MNENSPQPIFKSRAVLAREAAERARAKERVERGPSPWGEAPEGLVSSTQSLAQLDPLVQTEVLEEGVDSGRESFKLPVVVREVPPPYGTLQGTYSRQWLPAGVGDAVRHQRGAVVLMGVLALGALFIVGAGPLRPAHCLVKELSPQWVGYQTGKAEPLFSRSTYLHCRGLPAAMFDDEQDLATLEADVRTEILADPSLRGEYRLGLYRGTAAEVLPELEAIPGYSPSQKKGVQTLNYSLEAGTEDLTSKESAAAGVLLASQLVERFYSRRTEMESCTWTNRWGGGTREEQTMLFARQVLEKLPPKKTSSQDFALAERWLKIETERAPDDRMVEVGCSAAEAELVSLMKFAEH
jgi:hypothetical protein